MRMESIEVKNSPEDPEKIAIDRFIASIQVSQEVMEMTEDELFKDGPTEKEVMDDNAKVAHLEDKTRRIFKIAAKQSSYGYVGQTDFNKAKAMAGYFYDVTETIWNNLDTQYRLLVDKLREKKMENETPAKVTNLANDIVSRYWEKIITSIENKDSQDSVFSDLEIKMKFSGELKKIYPSDRKKRELYYGMIDKVIKERLQELSEKTGFSSDQLKKLLTVPRTTINMLKRF